MMQNITPLTRFDVCAAAILAKPFCGAEAGIITIQRLAIHVGVADEAHYEVCERGQPRRKKRMKKSKLKKSVVDSTHTQ